MIKNYLITSLRSLWRNRLFTALNIFGLAIGISACWMVYSIIRHEFNYNASIAGKENIYRIVSGFMYGDKESHSEGVSAPIYQGIRKDMQGVTHVVPMYGEWKMAVQIPNSPNPPLIFEDPTNIVSVDTAYFNMISYQWLAGHPKTALSAPENVILTESRMNQYFPGKTAEEVINKTYTSYGFRDTLQKTVSGIVKDLPYQSEFNAKEFYVLSNDIYELSDWTNTSGSDYLYLKLPPQAQPEQIKSQIQNLVELKQKEFSASQTQPLNLNRWFEILPLREVHFTTYLKDNTRKASKPVLLGLAGIGLFLLILAGINYINMSVAQIPQRAKEIGVRKTLGGSRSLLIGQFLMETLLTTSASAVIAFLLGSLGFWFLKDLIPAELNPFDQIFSLILFTAVSILLITLTAGIYPALLITRVKTVNVFKNVLIEQKSGSPFSLQKGLIVFQFTIALIFILGSLIGGKQLQYTLKRDMGFDKDAVVLVDIPWKYRRDVKYMDKQFPLLDELRKESGIRQISLGTAPLVSGYTSSPFIYTQDGKEPIRRQLIKKWVDTAYLQLYDMKLIAGRNLLPSDTTIEVVLNETAVKEFGFHSPQDAIGKNIKEGNDVFPICGVVKDFHMQNFYSEIDPAALMSSKRSLGTFNIKLDKQHSAQWPGILATIEKKWAEFYPAHSFNSRFYDQNIEQLYVQEHRMSRLINLTTVIAIFISCLGLFGLASLTVYQRTKEIGIRKVLGASVSGIIQLLTKEYIGLVLLALLIASPIAWWAMNKWLTDFVYRIEIEWWMFGLAGLGAIAIALITVSYLSIKAAVANPIDSLRNYE